MTLHARDLLVMAGTMQESYQHALRPTAAKAFAGKSRINITVRAFKPNSEAVKSGASTSTSRAD